MPLADEFEECPQSIEAVPLGFRAALDDCQKILNWLRPPGKVGAGLDEGAEPVLVPLNGPGAQVC
ncbi:hypothetical protein ES703_119609 [subsurface metagenome]